MTNVVNTVAHTGSGADAPAKGASLLTRAKALDPQAWADIYDHNYDRVYGYALRMSRSMTVAEKIASATFQQAVEKIAQYYPQITSLSSWLMAITRSLAVEHLESIGLSPHEPLNLELMSTEPLPEQVASAGGLWDRLQDCLDHLPKEDRQVLVLRFIVGLTCEETSFLLCRSEDNIKASQHRGLAFLVSRMGQEQEDA